MKKYAVITVLDNLSETSMPWNEFVLYRHEHEKALKQYVIVCDSPKDSNNVPEDLDITFTGFNPGKIRSTMKRIVSECKANHTDFVIHLHQNKSAAFFNLSTLFSGYAKKTVFTVHSQFPAYNIQNKAASFFNALRAERVINVSATSYAVYPDFMKRLKKDRMTYIENGVDVDRIDGILQGHKRKKRQKKCFVYVARMIPLKKHDFLIDVFQKVDADFELLLIGAEDAEGRIRSKVRDSGISDKVTMTGLIPRNELFEKLADSDVYVSSSTIEGLPVSVLEAMTVGLPAVVSDIEPHREILRVCSETAVLPFDEDVWIKKINEIINMPDEELAEWGRKCREAVISEFSLQTMHQKYNTEYEKLLK